MTQGLPVVANLKNGEFSLLAEKYQSNFYIFLCNPHADKRMKDASNVFKLKGVEKLTDISITLTKALRELARSPTDLSAGRS